MFLFILSFSFVSANLCYQETANVSTECGGLGTGSYTASDNWGGNLENTYDGDWSTWGYPAGSNDIAYFDVNYTKPSGALSTSFLNVKDAVADNRNVSILQSCWDYSPTTLMFKAQVIRGVPVGIYGVNWSCYNGTTWAFLSNGDDDSLLYEEGMWWDIQNETETNWTESLNAGLFAYYDFSDATDKIGDYDLATAAGTPQFILNATAFQGASGWTDENSKWKISDNDQMDFVDNNYQFTINVWMRTDKDGNYYFINKQGTIGSYFDSQWLHWDPVITTIGTSNINDPTYAGITPNEWFMLTITRNTTHSCYFINGTTTNARCQPRAVNEANAEDMNIGGDYGADTTYKGYFDEMKMWNRSLSLEEINYLYNFYLNNTQQNGTTENQTCQTCYWNLSGTNLYPASLNYWVGIGTLNPASALQVIGTVLVSNNLNVTGKIFSGNGSLQLGTQDAFGRYQIWNFLPNSVLRLGSLGADGDAQTVSSEGIVVYGNNSKDDMISSSNFSYARIKPNRIGLYTSINNIADYYFRVDPTSLFLKNDSFTKTFEVTRQTGLVNSKTGYSTNGQAGITNNTNFWMCKDSACNTTCQVDIRGGIIVGCV